MLAARRPLAIIAVASLPAVRALPGRGTPVDLWRSLQTVGFHFIAYQQPDPTHGDQSSEKWSTYVNLAVLSFSLRTARQRTM
jgi:hypothetical protein